MTKSSRSPIGLVGALLLVVSAELVAFRGRSEVAPFIPSSWKESGRAASREAVGAEVLCLGDSQVKCGLQPRALGRSAYNLAVVGGQSASSYYLLRRALDAGARPSAVVVDFFPGLLALDVNINLRGWAELLDAGECLDLIRRTREPKLAVPLLSQWLLPSLRMRDEIRAGISAALLEEPDTERVRGDVYRLNWKRNHGAHALAENPQFRDGIEPDRRHDGNRWKPRPEHLAFVRRFLKLAETADVPVFWLLPTVAPGAQSVLHGDGREAAYLRFVRSIQAESPGLYVLDPSSILNSPTGSFRDVYHLDHRGAVALSEAVSDVLDRALTGGLAETRFVTLKPREGASFERSQLDVVDATAIAQGLESRARR